MNAEQWTHDATLSSDRIEQVTGRRPRYYRFAEFAAGAHGGLVNPLGMHTIHAVMDSDDWRGASIAASVQLLTRGGRTVGSGQDFQNIDIGGWNGMIMLYHDAGGDASSFMYTQNNARIFSEAIPYLQGLGYAFVTVEELLTIMNRTPATGAGGGAFNGFFGISGQWDAWNREEQRARFVACPAGYYAQGLCRNPLCR